MIEYYPSGQRKSRSVYSRELGGADFRKVSYEYDTCGRLSNKKYPGDSVSSPNRIEYTYDSFGSLAQITDKRAEGNVGSTDTISYEYDILGRVTTITLWDGKTLNYTYTSAGQRASVEVKDETDTRMLYTRYVYDLLGRLIEVYENNAGTGETQIAEYAYDKDGSNNPRMTLTYNQVTSGSRTYVSDSLGRIRTITNAAGGVTVSSFDYAVSGSTDGMGRRTHAYINLAAASGQGGTPTTVFNEYYTYDKLGRLVDWDVNSGTYEHEYEYDDVGNRTEIDSSPYTYQLAGQIYGVSSADSDILESDPNYDYFYDANGSLIKRAADSNNYRLYYYDWEQKLVKVEDYVSSSLDKTINYTYDPLGNLIKRVEDSTTTTFTVDMNNSLPVVLIETTGSVVEKNTWGDDLLFVERSGDGEQSQNGDFYYFYDGLGSTRTITETDGTVICRYVYDVYGKPLSSETYESQPWNSFKFTGEYYDSYTEHVYLRARWYDPSTGRFLTRDEFISEGVLPSMLHAFIYCGNEPVNRHDASGYDYTILSVFGCLDSWWFRGSYFWRQSSEGAASSGTNIVDIIVRGKKLPADLDWFTRKAIDMMLKVQVLSEEARGIQNLYKQGKIRYSPQKNFGSTPSSFIFNGNIYLGQGSRNFPPGSPINIKWRMLDVFSALMHEYRHFQDNVELGPNIIYWVEGDFCERSAVMSEFFSLIALYHDIRLDTSGEWGNERERRYWMYLIKKYYYHNLFNLSMAGYPVHDEDYYTGW